MILLPVVLIIISSCGMRNDYQQSLNLNKGWKFLHKDDPLASEKEYDDADWEIRDLPHDWAIELPVKEDNPGETSNGYFEGGVAWYRKHIDIPPEYRDKSVYLQFEGIYRDASIYINGKFASNQKYGYNEIVIDAGQYLEYGENNLVAIRVDNSHEPSDRWYHGCGIYRDVNMIIANKVHIPLHGTYIRNEVFDSLDASVRISTEIRNDNDEPVEIMLVSHLFHPGEGKISVGSSDRIVITRDTVIEQVLEIEIPDMWSPENPVVYELVSDILSENNTILDTYISHFGIRKAEFDKDHGFMLNWKKVPLKGVCIHHDLGASGAAFYPSMMRTRLQVLKDCGVNAIRLSHNPHATELLDMCDEMGFIVIDELYDKWESNWLGHEDDFVEFMNTWEKDLEIFVRRDRNHPSVVIWSAGNETVEQLENPERGLEILGMLINKFIELDPAREVTCAMHPHGELPSRLINLTRVVSYNYQTENFHKWRQEFPDKVFIATETKVYQEGDVEDYSVLDFTKNSWFMLEEPDAGQFIWAGIDYLGETRGWPDKGIRTGFITSNGFIKPYGQFQRSIYSGEPMVHITVLDDTKLKELNEFDSWQKKWYGPPLSSHWNWDKDSVDLYIFTNVSSVKLELNFKPVGIFNKNDFGGGVIHARIKYEPGTIRASEESGSASHSLQTAGEPAILLTRLREHENYETVDGIREIEVWVCDKDSIPCPVSGDPVTVSFDENIRFIGADNGDMADHTLYVAPVREIRDGKCLFVFRKENTGSSSVTFSNPYLQDVTIIL